MIYWRRKWQPLQYSCLENPMDGGASWATVHEVGKSLTWLSNFTFTSFGCKEAVFFPFPSFSCPSYSLFSLLFPSGPFVCYHFLPFSHCPPSLLPFFFLHPGTHLSRRSTRRASDLIGSHHLLTPSKSLWSRDGKYQTGNFLLWWSLTQITWPSKGNSGTLHLWKGDMTVWNNRSMSKASSIFCTIIHGEMMMWNLRS